MHQTSSDRRSHARQQFTALQVLVTSIEFPVTDPPYNYARDLVDVSFGGLSFVSREHLSRGSAMAVDLRLHGTGGRVRAPATVTWCQPREDGTSFLVGVRFDDDPWLTGGAVELFGPGAVGREARTSDAAPDRRQHERGAVEASRVRCVPMGFMAWLRLAPDVGDAVLDISRTGVQLRTTRKLSPGARAEVSIVLPDLGEFRTVATVRWCVTEEQIGGRRFRTGLTFGMVSESSREVLDALTSWFQTTLDG